MASFRLHNRSAALWQLDRLAFAFSCGVTYGVCFVSSSQDRTMSRCACLPVVIVLPVVCYRYTFYIAEVRHWQPTALDAGQALAEARSTSAASSAA